VFRFAGSDLVPVPGSSSEQQRYRPRTEDGFSWIVRRRGDDQDYWEVHGWDGLRSTFGIPRPTDAADTWRDPNVIADPEAKADRTARLRAERMDFPADLDRIQLSSLALLIVRSEQNQLEAVPPPQFSLELLRLVRGAKTTGGDATTVASIVSTRRPNGLSWQPLLTPPAMVQVEGVGQPLDSSPFVVWELALADQPTVRQALRDGTVQDPVLFLGYAADRPRWPD
jgi:hypothetical protein